MRSSIIVRSLGKIAVELEMKTYDCVSDLPLEKSV